MPQPAIDEPTDTSSTSCTQQPAQQSKHEVELRDRLVEQLLADGAITSATVEGACRAVPRHRFAPEVSLEQAYANDVIRTKFDQGGTVTSSVSAPWLQARMLEAAQVRPGMRCLEIGSGGYNAALIAELAGPAGEITTVDIDPWVTERARRFLDNSGYEDVRVVLADAEHGVAARAPFDRIIVAVGVWDVPLAWIDQLAEGGRLVLPLRIHGMSRTVTMVREGDHLISVEHLMAGFVAMQGAGAHPTREVALHEEVSLVFDEDDGLHDGVDDGGAGGLGAGLDVSALRAALDSPRVAVATDVTFRVMESFDGLLLWLATTLDRVCMLRRAQTDTARELVDPASRFGTPTLLSATGFAYLAYREIDPDDEGRRFEFSAHAHGPDADDLVTALAEQIRVWDRGHRRGPDARFSIHPASTPPALLPPGGHVRKRHSIVTITWPLP